MKATLRQPSSFAARAISSGEASSASLAISRDLLMSQFWQNLQREIAAFRAEGEHGGAGKEVIERLLLDRIHAESAGSPVGRQDNLTVLTGADETEAALTFPKGAEARADVALDPAVLEPVPVLGRNDGAPG